MIDYATSFPAEGSGNDTDSDGLFDEPAGFQVRTGTTSVPIYIDFDGNERIGASIEHVELRISEFVYVTGSIEFLKGPVQDVDVTGGLLSELGAGAGEFLTALGLPSDFASSFPATGGSSTQLAFMTVGGSNLHAFVGMDGPYWTDLDSDRDISWALPDGTTRTNQDGTPMVNITVDNVQYGDLNGDGKVDANETAELDEEAVGLTINDFDFGLAIMTPTNSLDFAKYFALKASADQIALVGIDDVTVSAEEILVEVNQSSPSVYGLPLFPVVDFAGTSQFASEQLVLFDADNSGRITLGDLATLNAALAVGFADLTGVALNDPTPVDHDTLVGILNTDDTGSSRGVIDITEAAALLGGDAAAVTAAELADVDGDGKIDPLGYEVGTGGDPVYLSMDSPVIRAQGFVELNIFDVVILTGSVAFELGPTQDVTLTNGSTRTVTTMTIGAANVTAFVGAFGPYWTDLDGDHEVSWTDVSGNTLTQAQAGSADTVVDVDETAELNGNAIGLQVTDLDVGIMVMAATGLNDLGVYLAAKASVHSFGVVGVPGLTAAGQFNIELNLGFGTSGVAVVDFDASFSEQLALFDQNGDGTITVSDLRTLTGNNSGTGAFSGLYAAGDAGALEVDLGSIVLALDTAGNDDGLLQVAEAAAVLANASLAETKDEDGDGILDAGFEVNTGDPTSPVVLDFNTFLISIQLGGNLDLVDTFRLSGVFLFQADPQGLKIFVNAGLSIGPSGDFFDLQALGVLIINGDGVAADFEIDLTIGGDLSASLSNSGLAISGRLIMNTTGLRQAVDIPDEYVDDLSQIARDRLQTDLVTGIKSYVVEAAAPSLGTLFDDSGASTDPLSAPGFYITVAFSAQLRLGGVFDFNGKFGILVTGSKFEFLIGASLALGPLGQMGASGSIRIDSTGIVGRVELALDVGGLGTVGLDITGDFLFEINTTGMTVSTR